MRIVNLHHGAFVNIFRKLGHDVLSIGTTPDCDVVLKQPLSYKRFLELLENRGMHPDLIFWCDACQTPWVFGIENMPCVTIGYSVDQYMNPWHVPFSAGFDAFFVAQKDYLPLFTASPTDRPATWMPLFCDPGHDQDAGMERDIPISFVGTLDGVANPGRRPFLTAFRRLAPLFLTTGYYVPIFGRSRIVLNQSAAGELNLRLFQGMACGATLLTEETDNGLHDLFTPGVELLTYRRGDAEHAAQRALAALARSDLTTIAQNGRRKTLAKHSIVSRAKVVLAQAALLAAQGAPKTRLARRERVRAEVQKAYAVLATDEALPLPASERQFFLHMAQPC